MAQQSKYSEGWLGLEQALGMRPILKGSALEMRKQYNELGRVLASQSPSPSTAVQAADRDVDGLKLRIYTPTHVGSGELLPIGVFAHAGGLVMGDIDSEDTLCRAVAEKTPSIIISVNYRLAPEHKSPAQLEDMANALRWAYGNASVFGGDRSKLFTIGTSAGGGLALAISRMTLLGQSSLPKDAVKGVVALAPVTMYPAKVPKKWAHRYLSYFENGEDVPIINRSAIDELFTAAVVREAGEKFFVGLDESTHRLFPPTYIVTCGVDPLRDDGAILAESFKFNGVKVKYDTYEGLPHMFWMFPSLPETSAFMSKLLDGVNYVLQKL
ncbi:uncharacterized protein HMPREF1541_06199 [Cyphellophora europaea CBS 101466]|uniref:Alpha/beta hydrolase fold-3 domain-containing protein n=1 Tax=Cyphellophora europaea (strain CBS 101466) TaxID=1220924 RepID=W2RU68_CYPE1|nr:uncharacterized protein HMPREF1541_06199 [Cyphellophora europaea CBS 101466]ETN39972.1 hypothetical protein HMPREF1541_06199 [Cyphellophora europaea CBS 101466]